jgi:hypothetical protein
MWPGWTTAVLVGTPTIFKVLLHFSSSFIMMMS